MRFLSLGASLPFAPRAGLADNDQRPVWTSGIAATPFHYLYTFRPNDSAGETPLHGAAAWGHAEMVSYLISVGARIDLPGTTGLTPLHWAAGWGNLETVQVLVKAGADLNARNAFGRTPEQVAVEPGRQDIAAYLRERNAT